MKNLSKIRTINSKTLISTVDISKNKHSGYFRTIENKEIKPFEFSNTMSGFMQYWKRLQAFKEQNKLNEIVFAFEPTGSYGIPLVHYMKSKGARLIQVNPMHTKRIKEIGDNSPNKTDSKDPKVIADLVCLGHGLTVNIPEGLIADLRHEVLFRENLMEDINRIKNRIEGLLVQFFPEFLKIMKGLHSKTSIYLLTYYIFPIAIIESGLTRLSKEIKKVSNGRLGGARAKKLINSAKNTIGIHEGTEGMKNVINAYIKQLDLLTTQLKEKELIIENMLGKIPYSHLLMSMKGIGKITAAILISEVLDFKSYSTIPEIIKLAGLNLYEVSSGKHKGDRRIAKRGRTLLRKALYFASLNMIRKGGIFHEEYQNHLSKGMKKIKAVIAISKKLLRTIYSMVRNNTEYIENYETFKKAA